MVGGGLVAKLCPSAVTPWTAARQVPLSTGFSRQEYWDGSPCPPPGDLANPGIRPTSPALAGGFFTSEPPGKCHQNVAIWQKHLQRGLTALRQSV